MFKRILVALDGSPEAEFAFSPLRKLLLRKDSEVVLFQALTQTTLTHVTDSGMSLLGVDEGPSTYLEKMRLRLEKEGVRVTTMIESGPPANAILKAAKELEVSLIVMSTHGRSGFVRWMLGSVTEDVLRRSPVPVLVAHSKPPELRFHTKTNRTILVPFDGTEESLAGAPLAVEMARFMDAGVAVLRVESGSPGGSDLGFVGLMMDGPASLEGQPQLLDRDLVEAGNRFASQGLKTTLFRVRGDTASMIIQLAWMLPADAIVMASHGRQGVSRLMSGSVAEEVARKSEAPVLVHRIGSEPPIPAAAERRAS